MTTIGMIASMPADANVIVAFIAALMAGAIPAFVAYWVTHWVRSIQSGVRNALLERQLAVEAEELRRQDPLIRQIKATIADHARTLRTKRRQLARPDEYGVIDEEPWAEHRLYFVERVVLHPIPDGIPPSVREHIHDWVEEAIDDLEAAEEEPIDHEVVDQMTGIEFEQFCAAILEQAGWRVTGTKITGDQGADLIASRGRARVVVQCKRQARSVGNGAVQQVIAAMGYEDGTHAAVVSNAAYTRSAVSLATKSGVYLLNYGDLPVLHELIEIA